LLIGWRSNITISNNTYIQAADEKFFQFNRCFPRKFHYTTSHYEPEKGRQSADGAKAKL